MKVVIAVANGEAWMKCGGGRFSREKKEKEKREMLSLWLNQRRFNLEV